MKKIKNKSIYLILFSAFTFSAMQIIVKVLTSIPLMEKVLFRNIISLFFAFIMIKKNSLTLWGEKKNRKYLFFRSFFGFAGVVLFFYATTQMLAADAAMINKLSPIFITILSCIFLKEKICKINILSLVISFVGAWLIIKPELNATLIPIAAGLVSAIVSAAAYMFITLIGENEDIYTIVFTYSLFSVVCSIPPLLFDFVMPNLIELIMLLLLGTLAALGQISLTYAYNESKASDISIYDYSNIVFSSILGFIFLKEIPDLMSIIGGILIIIASLIVFIYHKKN